MQKNSFLIPHGPIEDFCRRWQITEFALFGSVLRDDFQASSDVDVLLTFSPNAPWSLFEFVVMREELSKIFGRPVDLVERDSLRNPFRRKAILESLKVLYAA